MTVKELRKMLKKLPNDAIIWIPRAALPLEWRETNYADVPTLMLEGVDAGKVLL